MLGLTQSLLFYLILTILGGSTVLCFAVDSPDSVFLATLGLEVAFLAACGLEDPVPSFRPCRGLREPLGLAGGCRESVVFSERKPKRPQYWLHWC